MENVCEHSLAPLFSRNLQYDNGIESAIAIFVRQREIPGTGNKWEPHHWHGGVTLGCLDLRERLLNRRGFLPESFDRCHRSRVTKSDREVPTREERTVGPS